MKTKKKQEKNHSGAVSDSKSLMKLEMMEKMGGGKEKFLPCIFSAVFPSFFLLLQVLGVCYLRWEINFEKIDTS